MTTEAETLTGRALDRAVGEALGFNVQPITDTGCLACWRLHSSDGTVDFPYHAESVEKAWEALPAFSASPDAAFNLVVAAMQGRGLRLRLEDNATDAVRWIAAFGEDVAPDKWFGWGRGPTAPEAICIAALDTLNEKSRALAAEQEAGQ